MPLLSWLTPCFPGRLFRAEHDPGPGQVIGRELHRDLVARKHPDVMHAHLARNMAKNHMAVFQLDAECSVGEVLDDLALHLNDVVLCHIPAYRIGRPGPLKFAFLSSESYWWDIM